MTLLLLGLDLAFVALAFGLRTLGQWRRTGDTGWRLGRPHSRAEAAARALLLASAPLLLAATLSAETHSPLAGVGIALMLLGIAVTVGAQWNMGAAWRIGVDPAERTELVREGLYRHVRNPIYSGMALFVLGQALVTPNAWAGAAVAALLLGIELQVRAVEEPYLRATHGARFLEWASRAGRFAPYVGRIRVV
jgi:protein-S-isoprenylcysteine O-methyltransferase Ste14